MRNQRYWSWSDLTHETGTKLEAESSSRPRARAGNGDRSPPRGGGGFTNGVDGVRFGAWALLMSASSFVACGGVSDEPLALETRASALTADERVAACARDPRVMAGLVSADICAGADIFFRETFEGNGRTCGSCHPASNNLTIDRPFIDALRETTPDDPLFVAETDSALAELESSDLADFAGIREHVDGFDKPPVSRGVPHTLSLATSLARDATDGTTNPPVQRTGWSGDGAPGTGSLREFLTGAIIQHYPTDLDREPGVAFRLPSPRELDLVQTFQLSLGRTNELDLRQVNLADPGANDGRLAYLDPQRGRCNFCHANGGANSELTGANANFDTGTRTAPTFAFPFDGGFGGVGAPAPNINALEIPELGLNAFGDGTFNTPPVIEAVDNPPFFHTNAFGPSIEGAVAFYIGPQFRASPAARDLEARFGTPIEFTGDDINNMGRFLRVLSSAFNLDIARQRLDAARVLASRFRDQGRDIQLGLVRLAEVEIDDALENLETAIPILHPAAIERLNEAKQELGLALSAPDAGTRQNRVSNALSRVLNARDQFGANINFRLGQGNLMF